MNYIHFCDIPIVYINEKSKWNTPIGLHAYPEDFVKECFRKDDLYFGMDRKKAIHLEIASNKVLDLRDYQLNPKHIKKLNEICSKMNLNFESVKKKSVKNPIHNSHSGALWSLMYNMLDEHFDLENFDKQIVEHPSGITYADNNKPAKSWNKILRYLNIEVVVDNGMGIIHAHEPKQVLFLTENSFKITKIEDNNYNLTSDI